MNQLQFLGSIEIGFIFALVTIGIYITFKIIDFLDLTVDGSFTLGAAVSSAMIAGGFDPVIATIPLLQFLQDLLPVAYYLNVQWDIMGLLAAGY